MAQYINPFPQHFDSNGDPLASYTVYFGEENQDPKTFPKAPFSDKGLTVALPTAQVLSSTGAYGSDIYLNGAYSIRIETTLGSLWREIPSFSGIFNSSIIFGFTAVSMIADSSLDPGVFIQTLGYNTNGDGGDNYYEIEAAAAQVVDGGRYILLDNGNIAKGLFPGGDVTIKQFGAIGDGVADDTTELEAWFAYGQFAPIVADDGTYLYTGSGLVTATDLTDSFTIDGKGMVIECNPASEQFFAIQVTVADSSAIDNIEFKNITINGNGKFAYGISVNDAPTTGTNSLGYVTIERVTVDGLDNDNLASNSSTSGIRVTAIASNVSVEKCFAININRTQLGGGGSVSSTGISIFNGSSVISIKDNNIRSILSPVGSDDADGVIVFGLPDRTTTPAVAQSARPVIADNKISNCKGRHIKCQIANAVITGNYLESLGIELITNFHAIDQQIGGAHIYGNYIKLDFSVGGTSASFIRIANAAGGDLEATSHIHDNVLQHEVDMTYGIQIGAGSDTNVSVNIHDNTSRSTDGTGQIFTGIQLDLPETAIKFELDVVNNSFAIGDGRLIQGTGTTNTNWEDVTKGPIMSAYITMRITGNTNSLIDIDSDIFNATDSIPYLQDVVMAANQGFSRSGVSLNGFSADSAPEGNSFYYFTDGGAGGILDTPTGYDRNVTFETNGERKVKITTDSGDTFATSRKGTTVWYEYTGVLIP